MNRFASASRSRCAAVSLGVLGFVAAAGSSVGACTSGVTPDCSDAQCAVVIDAAQAESGDDGTTYASESGAESGADEGTGEAGDTDGGSPESASSADASDSGDQHDTGTTDAGDGGSRDAPADG